jgi:hypothetical protein
MLCDHVLEYLRLHRIQPPDVGAATLKSVESLSLTTQTTFLEKSAVRAGDSSLGRWCCPDSRADWADKPMGCWRQRSCDMHHRKTSIVINKSWHAVLDDKTFWSVLDTGEDAENPGLFSRRSRASA